MFYRFFLFCVMTVVFVMSFGNFVLAATFPDVEAEHSNFLAIEYLVEIGTLEGYDDDTFKPNNTVNRAELMKILVAGQGLDPDDMIYKNCFPDVQEDWYAKYVCFAQTMGWVSGYPDGTFQPANTVNKVEATKMLVNALGLSENLVEDVTEELYEDTDNEQWYAPYVKVGKDFSLFEEEAYFYPTDGRTRAAISENIFRTLVVVDRAIAHYTEDERDAFLTEKGMEDLLVEAGEVEDSSGDETAERDCDPKEFSVILTAAGDSVSTSAEGTGTFSLDDGCFLNYSIEVSGLENDITSAHFHTAEGVLEEIVFEKDEVTGMWVSNAAHRFSDEELQQIGNGEVYVNVHTSEYPDGELSGYLVEGSAQEDQAQQVSLEAGNYFFAPDTITAAPGEKITITFGQVEGSHNFVIDELDIEQTITTGTVITFDAPEAAGEYAYYCGIGSHRSMGMEGVLTVE